MGKEKLADEVLERLGTEIAAGVFGPNQTIPTETELMGRYEVGRSSVREAVRTLSELGMVLTAPRRGTIVAPRKRWNMLNSRVMRWVMTNEDLAPDLLVAIEEARVIFEPPAAALAALRADRMQIIAIETAYARMEQAAEAGDPQAAILADAQFHLSILQATGNPILAAFNTALDAVLGLLFSVTANHMDNFRSNLANHLKVLEAIRSHDAETARLAMLDTISFTSVRMREAGLIA